MVWLSSSAVLLGNGAVRHGSGARCGSGEASHRVLAEAVQFGSAVAAQFCSTGAQFYSAVARFISVAVAQFDSAVAPLERIVASI